MDGVVDALGLGGKLGRSADVREGGSGGWARKKDPRTLPGPERKDDIALFSMIMYNGFIMWACG